MTGPSVTKTTPDTDTPVTPPVTPKTEMRRELLSRRAGSQGGGSTVAQAVVDLLTRTHFLKGKIIAGYYPIGHELDCRPALAAVAAAGATLCLPVAAAHSERLIFRVWQLEGPLEAGPFGTSHPPVSAGIVEPNVLLVPLIGFDQHGNRLGYGAGYYDRTLAAIREEKTVLAIGLAFDVQEVPMVQVDMNDQPLDFVVTESRTLACATTAHVSA